MYKIMTAEWHTDLA